MVGTAQYTSSNPVCVVLVHGACHGSWCWEEVTGPLESLGFEVRAVDLPFTTFADDARVVSDAVQRAKRGGSQVLLVGHSHGGVVISEAGHAADELMFCAGTMPGPGESPTDVYARTVTPELTAALRTSEDGAVLGLDPAAAAAALYNRCTPEQVAAATPRLRTMQRECMDQRVERPAWLTVPSSYVVCSDDRTVDPAYQRLSAERLGDHVTFDADHAVFYSARDQLVERIADVATRLGTSDRPD